MSATLICQYVRDRDAEEFCVPVLEARYGAQVHPITGPGSSGYYGIYVAKADAQAAYALLLELLNVYEKEEHGGSGEVLNKPFPISSEETEEREKVAKARVRVVKLWALSHLLREGDDRAMHDAGDLIDEYAAQHAKEHEIHYTSLQEEIERYPILKLMRVN